MAGAAEHGALEGGMRRTLAEKIEYLFEIAAPAGRRPPSHEEVATAINIQAGEKTISATYVWQLRTGKRTNPTKKHLEALASYFGVNPVYFFDDEQASAIDEQLALLQVLKQQDVRNLVLRANELSASSRRTLAGMISQLGESESESAGAGGPSGGGGPGAPGSGIGAPGQDR